MKRDSQKEMARLQKNQKFFGSKWYFWALIIVLAVIYVVDELTSNIRYSVQTYTICDLFHTTFNSTEYAGAQATLGLVTTAAYLPIMAVALIILWIKVKETKNVDLDNVEL